MPDLSECICLTMLSDSVPCFLYEFFTGKTKFYIQKIYPIPLRFFSKRKLPKFWPYLGVKKCLIFRELKSRSRKVGAKKIFFKLDSVHKNFIKIILYHLGGVLGHLRVAQMGRGILTENLVFIGLKRKSRSRKVGTHFLNKISYSIYIIS